MKRLIPVLILILALLPRGYAYELKKGSVLASYESPTLTYTMRRYVLNSMACHVIDLKLTDPAQQIRKAASPWHESLSDALDLAETIPGTVLAINGSGYVSPRYPEIPEDYPGESSDYWYEPLGSVTVTDGTVLRCLDGVPYYGLTLEADGLKMIVGEDPESVLEHDPSQTWSFYDGCPLVRDGESILDTQWDFAGRRARRTVIAGFREKGHYLIFMVLDKPGVKLTHLTECLIRDFNVDWAYNLDGGPSSALIRLKGQKKLTLVGGGDQKVADIMAFTE